MNKDPFDFRINISNQNPEDEFASLGSDKQLEIVISVIKKIIELREDNKTLLQKYPSSSYRYLEGELLTLENTLKSRLQKIKDSKKSYAFFSEVIKIQDNYLKNIILGSVYNSFDQYETYDVRKRVFDISSKYDNVDLLLKSLANGHEGLFKVMLEGGMIDVMHKMSAWTSLLSEVSKVSSPNVIQLFLDCAGIKNPNGLIDFIRKTNDYSSPLQDSAKSGNLAVVKFCLSFGLDVNSKDTHNITSSKHFDKTPLALACGAGHGEVVKELIMQGADLNLILGESDDESPLEIVIQNGNWPVFQILIDSNPQINSQHLETAILYNRVDMLERILQINQSLIESYPLLERLKIRFGLKKSLTYSGIEDSYVDPTNSLVKSRIISPIEYAITKERMFPIIEVLLKYGAKIPKERQKEFEDLRTNYLKEESLLKDNADIQTRSELLEPYLGTNPSQHPAQALLQEGQNNPANIRISGLDITTLESYLKFTNDSTSPLLGPQESLIELLISDWNLVNIELNLTMREIAEPLARGIFAYELDLKRFGYNKVLQTTFYYQGKKYIVKGDTWAGGKATPFNFQKISHHYIYIQDPETNKKIGFGGILPWLINQFGFFEGKVLAKGKANFYRVNPEEVANFFGLKTKVN